MSLFTDEDIQKLHDQNCLGIPWLPALLERLEAAEAYGNAMSRLFRDPENIKRLYRAWRKASGCD